MRLSLRGVLLFVLLALALLASTPVLAERDFYKILGLSNDASDQQIKKAFRKLSLKYHPDKNKGDESARKQFMDVNDANEVLSNPDKRATYDLHGEDGLKKEKEAGNRPSGGLFDLFGGGMQQGGKRRGPDFRMEFPVTLEDLYNGSERTLKVQRKVICKASDTHTRKTARCGSCRSLLSSLAHFLLQCLLCVRRSVARAVVQRVVR